VTLPIQHSQGKHKSLAVSTASASAVTTYDVTATILYVHAIFPRNFCSVQKRHREAMALVAGSAACPFTSLVSLHALHTFGGHAAPL